MRRLGHAAWHVLRCATTFGAAQDDLTVGNPPVSRQTPFGSAIDGLVSA